MLLVKFNNRAILNRQVREMIEETASEMGTKIFDTKIREGIVVREAQAMQKSLFKYAPTCKPYIDYKEFTKEFLKEL